MKKKYDLAKMKIKKRGAVVSSDVKIQKTIRIDLDVLSWLLKEGEKRGLPYQTLINSILKETMNKENPREDLKKLVRKVVKEELKKAS